MRIFCGMNHCPATKASSQAGCCIPSHVYNMRISKVSCQLTWQTLLFFLSANTWLSQPADRFQSSVGYKSQQDSSLDFIYHQPWVITGLSLSLRLMTYFRCSHTLQNQIWHLMIWSGLSSLNGLQLQPCKHTAGPQPNRGVKLFQSRV